MRWQDIDLDAKVWRLDQTRVVANGKAVDSTPKAGSSRVILLDDHLVALLRAHRARQAAEKLVAGEAYEDSGFLIADELGRPYYPDSLSTWFDRQVKDVGLPRIRLHDTRHTAASLMISAGEPVKVVSEMLGHSSPRVTLEVYAHVMPGMAEEAGAALSARLLA
jgi:integrase